jgi:type IV fimbrial biogenesis protein FimT
MEPISLPSTIAIPRFRGAAMRDRMRRQSYRRRSGMTLLELAVVATLAALMLGVVVPRIASFREQNLLDSTAHGLARDIARARSEAIKRNAQVSVTRLADTAYRVAAEPHRRLPPDVRFNTASVGTVTFSPFGIIQIGAGTMRLDAGSRSRRVIIRTSGHVRVE